MAARNAADNMIHATTKSLEELGDQVEADEKSRIESAIAALQTAMKGEDKDEIEAKTKELAEASGKLAERVYAQKGGEQAGGAEAQPGAEAESGASSSKEDVVDAEFEEVNNDKK